MITPDLYHSLRVNYYLLLMFWYTVVVIMVIIALSRN